MTPRNEKANTRGVESFHHNKMQIIEKVTKCTIPWQLLAILKQKSKNSVRVDPDVALTQIPAGPIQHQAVNLRTFIKEETVLNADNSTTTSVYQDDSGSWGT